MGVAATIPRQPCCGPLWSAAGDVTSSPTTHRSQPEASLHVELLQIHVRISSTLVKVPGGERGLWKK